MAKITICRNHPARPTPLISTLAFNGAEFWCPYCGANEGAMGAGRTVESSKALLATAAADEARSKDYLRARSMQVCSATLWNGEWIAPAKLPPEEKARLNKAIEDWIYEGRGNDAN